MRAAQRAPRPGTRSRRNVASIRSSSIERTRNGRRARATSGTCLGLSSFVYRRGKGARTVFARRESAGRVALSPLAAGGARRTDAIRRGEHLGRLAEVHAIEVLTHESEHLVGADGSTVTRRSASRRPRGCLASPQHVDEGWGASTSGWNSRSCRGSTTLPSAVTVVASISGLGIRSFPSLRCSSSRPCRDEPSRRSEAPSTGRPECARSLARRRRARRRTRRRE